MMSPATLKIASAIQTVLDSYTVQDFDTCIKQVAAHLHQQDKSYIEIAVDPKTKEIGWSFTPTPPGEDQLHSKS